jgi:hypothetical protein
MLNRKNSPMNRTDFQHTGYFRVTPDGFFIMSFDFVEYMN